MLGLDPLGETLTEAQTEIRVRGGLDDVSQFLHTEISRWGTPPGGARKSGIPPNEVPATLAAVSRSLRCLLEAVRGNEGNRTYLACLRDAQLLHSLLRFVIVAEDLLKSTTEVVLNCACNALCNSMKMLLGLTNNNAAGCDAFDGRIVSCLCRVAVGAVAGRGRVLPAEYEHDLSSLAITLLINLTEHNSENRIAVLDATMPKATLSPSKMLPRLGVVVVNKCARLDGQQGLRSSAEKTFFNVGGAYAAILFGCICFEHPAAVEQARSAIVATDIPPILNHLEDYLLFEQAAGMGKANTTVVQKVIAVLASLHA